MRPLLPLALAVVAGCASAPDAASDGLAADGPFVHHVRIRVVPYQTKAFEVLLADCARAARSVTTSDRDEWFFYREPPGRYWLLGFGAESGSLPLLSADDPVAALVDRVAERAPAAVSRVLRAQHAELEYVVEWSLLLQRRGDWCGGPEMEPEAWPCARLMVRTVREGRAAEFDQALTARTRFFVDAGFPLPLEGFVVRDGVGADAGILTAQAAFARSWEGYHSRDHFPLWRAAQPPAVQARYDARKQALMVTMARAEFFDGTFLPAQSQRAGGE